MKLKEVVTPIPLTSDGKVHILKSPVFDMQQAAAAKRFGEKIVDQFNPKDSFRVLELSSTLNYYNYNITTREFPENIGFQSRLERDLLRLGLTEIKAYNTPLLPTIGFEVESPRRPYVAESMGTANLEKYTNFFEKVGLSKNRASGSSVWEFSPPPSYSAEVQMHLLSELIKGGFIPSLHDSKSPKDIKEYLDGKLVSLHLNIGLRESAVTLNKFEVRYPLDFQILNTAIAIAFTSPERFRNKTHALWAYKSNSDSETMKKGYGKGGRAEFKGLEVRDSSVYRLMKQLQLLSACLLAKIENPDSAFAQIWDVFKLDVRYAFMERYYPNFPTQDKNVFAEFAEDKLLVNSLRSIINRHSLAAKQLLFAPVNSNPDTEGV